MDIAYWSTLLVMTAGMSLLMEHLLAEVGRPREGRILGVVAYGVLLMLVMQTLARALAGFGGMWF